MTIYMLYQKLIREHCLKGLKGTSQEDEKDIVVTGVQFSSSLTTCSCRVRAEDRRDVQVDGNPPYCRPELGFFLSNVRTCALCTDEEATVFHVVHRLRLPSPQEVLGTTLLIDLAKDQERPGISQAL